MNDEHALSLSEVWMSAPSANPENMGSTVDRILDRDREARDRERRGQAAAVFALALLVPVTLWAAVYGVAPLVRAAYALMAVGTALLVTSHWMYLAWTRQALPGPADARSQLQTIAFVLGRQLMLARMAPVLTAPVFIGVALIGVWLLEHRTYGTAAVVWTSVVAGWIVMTRGGAALYARLDERRLHAERVLAELG
jgi:uncharacterized membrane protein